jgi:hypothetical protein
MPLVRTGATEERLRLAGLVADLRREGVIYREIAERLGISRSYASELWLDPDGSKASERKDSYGGVCIDCGAPTTGSYGRALAPERCNDCSLARQSADRHWTREAVLDAIKRFASAHGRPPTADEWSTADPVNGYPPRTAVYSAGRKSSAHFDKWADAIEAAGFERPRVGGYVRRPRNPRKGRSQNVRDYIILELDDDGRWIQHEPVQSYSEALAIEKYVESLGSVNGRAGHKFVAVSAARWIVRELQAVTSFKAVAATA